MEQPEYITSMGTTMVFSFFLKVVVWWPVGRANVDIQEDCSMLVQLIH